VLPNDEMIYGHLGKLSLWKIATVYTSSLVSVYCLVRGHARLRERTIVRGGEAEVKNLKMSDEKDVPSIDFGIDEEEQREQEGETQVNMVKVGVREVDTYANMAQRFLQQYGSVVIGARGDWCSKAIMVLETMRDMGFITGNQKPQIEIGVDTIENGEAGKARSMIVPYRKPYIRITLSCKHYIVDTFDL
jgi:DNA-binding protein